MDSPTPTSVLISDDQGDSSTLLWSFTDPWPMTATVTEGRLRVEGTAVMVDDYSRADPITLTIDVACDHGGPKPE